MLLSRTGYSGKRFIFEKCHELGVKAVVLDAPDSWAQLMEKEGIISKFIPIDFADAEHAFDNCLKVFWGGGRGATSEGVGGRAEGGGGRQRGCFGTAAAAVSVGSLNLRQEAVSGQAVWAGKGVGAMVGSA